MSSASLSKHQQHKTSQLYPKQMSDYPFCKHIATFWLRFHKYFPSDVYMECISDCLGVNLQIFIRSLKPSSHIQWNHPLNCALVVVAFVIGRVGEILKCFQWFLCQSYFIMNLSSALCSVLFRARLQSLFRAQHWFHHGCANIPDAYPSKRSVFFFFSWAN